MKQHRMLGGFAALISASMLTSCATAPPPPATNVKEARSLSGVAVTATTIFFVGDDDDGEVFELARPITLQDAVAPDRRGVFQVDRLPFSNVAGAQAEDLESIDTLPDGSVGILSEAERALFVGPTIVARYPLPMATHGGRGLEGLSVWTDGSTVKVGAMTEGGFYRPKKLTAQEIAALGQLYSRRPALLCVHSYPLANIDVCNGIGSLIPIDVPEAPGGSNSINGQAFRATDFVWSRDGTELIVLLSSSNRVDLIFTYKWLQRFDINGNTIGEPLNLCDPYLPGHESLLPTRVRTGRAGNYEGLDWFDENSLILINDYPAGPATGVVIELGSWPATNKNVACQ